MVSGGQDSLALLHLLASGALHGDGPREVVALHVNHHLRGAESAADQTLVERACRRLAVGLVVRDAPMAKGAGNLQEGARMARRAAALDVARSLEAARVALGHTLDDQVETLLYRLGRYGGLRALAGMRPLDPPFVRPLLRVRRFETAAYCREAGLEFAVDRGNRDPAYARTGLRESVLPAWEDALPGAAQAAARGAEVAGEAAALIEALVERALVEVSVADGSMSAARLRRLPAGVRRALLRTLLEAEGGRGATRARVLALEHLLARPGRAELDLGAGRLARKEYDRVRLVEAAGAQPRRTERVGARDDPALQGAPEQGVPLPLPGAAHLGGLVVTAEEVDGFYAHDPRFETYLDGAAVAGPMWVRGPLPGDCVRPLGMIGTRSLQDLFVDMRLPSHLRGCVPVVVSAGRILWVGGLALAEEGRIGPTTDRVVRLAVRPEATRER
ncbi:MAG: tRNA lysidine(34) synthetase TilS [Thermoleophilia bacterium]|nr:tRNA lysidine(34) synthetase TilS [Thermoleophilia bacterium]